MEKVFGLITNYNLEIIFALIITCLILLILNIISQIRISKITKKYNLITEGVNEASLEDMLIDHLDEVKNVKLKLNDIESFCDNLNERLKLTVQRVGFIRYNAFNDMGSDLSFSVALLDENNNGFIISSLFGRNECNTYGKPIVNGKSSYKLSVEEIQALDRAKKYGLSEG
ncbi:MAG: DUF4446 family protein [Firmicutes bacterium]|nr:DUF4446 family protein [Bacillota bacterium]